MVLNEHARTVINLLVVAYFFTYVGDWRTLTKTILLRTCTYPRLKCKKKT